MTEIKGFYVVLEPGIGEERAEAMKSAIEHLRFVLSVESKVADYDHYAAVTQARHELRMQIYEVLNPKK